MFVSYIVEFIFREVGFGLFSREVLVVGRGLGGYGLCLVWILEFWGYFCFVSGWVVRIV